MFEKQMLQGHSAGTFMHEGNFDSASDTSLWQFYK